jgi:hypothetical protein
MYKALYRNPKAIAATTHFIFPQYDWSIPGNILIDIHTIYLFVQHKFAVKKCFGVLQFFIESRYSLKVPKREIFDRSDFPDFYTIKSLLVGDFGVKIKIFFTNI